MNTTAATNHILRVAAVAAALTTGAGAVASAQPMAVQAAPPAPPSYATVATGETIHGHISAINGKYSLTVRDDRGFVDDVTLHQGTIINPTGLTLQAGMQVTINGANAGRTFTANEIDTPYTVALVQPLYPVYPYGGFGFGGYGGFGFGGFGPGYRAGLLW